MDIMGIVVLTLQSCGATDSYDVVAHRLNYEIVVPSNPTLSQRFAAKELASFLEKIYDEPVILNGEKNPVKLVIGDSGKKRIAFDESQFGLFRWRNTIYFAGYDDIGVDPLKDYKGCSGTLTAVYYFLTKYLGVRFFFPGEDGYRLKKDPTIYFRGEFDIPHPSFEVRGIGIEAGRYSREENLIFFRRLLGNVPWWAKKDYIYYYLNKWGSRFKHSHPEYLGFYNGRRYSGKYPYHLPCYSNPEVLTITIEDIKTVLRENPSVRVVRLFADCPVRFCQCEKCRAMEERQYIGETEQNGEMLYGMAKKIMDGIHNDFPEIQFLVQTKLYTADGSYYNPPRLVSMGPQCTLHHLVRRNRMPAGFDHSQEVEVARAWLADGVKIVLKSYERYPEAGDYPLIKPHLDRNFFRLFVGIARGTFFSEASKRVPYSFSALGQYLQMRMLFDIDVDIDREVYAFCSFAYPGAAAEMVAFYKEMERLYADRSEFGEPLLADVYRADKLARAKTLLEQASEKVMPAAQFFEELYRDYQIFFGEAEKYLQNQTAGKE